MASSSTRKGAPTGLRLQRPSGGSLGSGEPSPSAGGWPGGLTVDTGNRGAHVSGDPSPNSLYSASPSASVSSQISRNHSFSLDYYALPSPAPQSPSATGAYPLPMAPPRSHSTSSTYSSYSQGITPIDGAGGDSGGPRAAYVVGSYPHRVSSKSSLSGQAGSSQTKSLSGRQSPGAHGGEISVSSPPTSPGSRKSSWGGSPLGGFLTLRKGSAGRSPKTPESPPSGARRKSSVTTVDTWELPNRPPPEPPKDEEVLDISWARKMVEEMEADSDGSGSSGGSRRGSTSTNGIPDFGLGVGLDDDQYSDSSVYARNKGSSRSGGFSLDGDRKRYDRLRAEDLGFSHVESAYNLSSASSNSHPSPGSQRAPQLPSSQTTPRQPEHSSSGRIPLGVGPSSRSSSSSPRSLASDVYSVHEAHPRPELPHSSSLEATNRRIHVIETSPGPSPTTSAHSIPSSDSLHPVNIHSPSNAGLSTSPAGSTSSSQGAAAGHSPLLSRGQSVFADEVSRRRSSDKARALAFVVPAGGSERSIGQLSQEVRYGTGEIVRLDDYPADYHQFGEGAHRPSPSRGREDAEWSAPVPEIQHPGQSLSNDGEEEDGGVEHEGGLESPALKAARERAARARSLHLASIQVTQATSPTTLSPQSSPSLAAYSFGAEQAKRTAKEGRSPKKAEPPLSEERKTQSLLLAVERPKRSSMRPMRTPSPAPSTDVPSSDVATVGASEISPKRMSTPSHAKQSSTSTIRASSIKPRRRSSAMADEAPARRRPSSSLDFATSASGEMRAASQIRDPMDSSRSSGTHARTLEELTAVLDLAINDSELDSNLAIGPNFGSPVRTSFGQGAADDRDAADDGTVSPKSSQNTRAQSPVPSSSAIHSQPTAPLPSHLPGLATGRAGIIEEKPKPRRMSKEVDPATKARGSTSSMATSAGNRSRIGSEDNQAGRSSISSQQSAGGAVITSAVRKTSSMASLGYPMGPPPQPPGGLVTGGRQPFYANNAANAQASRVSLADSTYSPMTASFAKTGKWPRAMVYTDIKTMRSPGERSVAYAIKINELQQAETGLGDWLRWKAHGGDSSRTAYRRNSPSLLGTIVEPTSRNVSSSSFMSGASEDFPLRGGPTIQATQMRNVSPPSGPPPNLPYPQLAPGIDGMRSSPSSASVRTVGPSQGIKSNEHAPMNTRPSITSSIASVASNPASFLHALGRRGSTTASQASRHKARSPPSSISSLPTSGGGIMQRSELSPRKGSIRGIEISGPTSFAKGSGQVDGDIPPGRTSMSSPLGPRAPSTTFGAPSTLSSERMSLEGSSISNHSPFALTPPSQHPVTPAPASPLIAPSISAQSPALKEMVEILDGDPRLLSKYLQQSGNDVNAAISTYLADQSNGTLLRV